jgi:hypothetical protein
MMDTITNIMSNWQAWAVWIVFVSLLIVLTHYFSSIPDNEQCYCEDLDFYDVDDWTEFQIEHLYECKSNRRIQF